MNKPNLKSSLLILSFSFLSLTLFAQKGQQITIQDERANEDYSYLKDSIQLQSLAALKFISLAKNSSSYLSIGGSFRPRFEHFTNRFWIDGNDENYYSQRLSFHTDWHFGQNIRFFGELYHGSKTAGQAFLQSDKLDFHQAFVEVNLPVSKHQLSFRLGRQEMKLGSGRLVDLGVGPNIRRSFDMGKISFQKDKVNLQAFYGKEVQSNFEAFDNAFSLFDSEASNPKLWGFYAQFSIFQNDAVTDNNELYYIGFQSDFSTFSDVMGEEKRHSIGLRRFGTINKSLTYNTEFIYQFGDIGGNNISAFSFETEWKYTFLTKKWKPGFGLKLDWSSGDKELADGQLQSFNPMFVNPAIYSLAAVNTPVNLIGLHPSFSFLPSKKMFVNVEWALFARASENDGLYSPPRFQTRMANGTTDRQIGSVFGLFLKYNYKPNISFDLRSSFFMTGAFIDESGTSEPIFQIAPTATFIF